MNRPSTLTAPMRRDMSRRPRRPLSRLLPIYLLILPGMALFLLWTIYPLADAFVMSFFQWNPNPRAASTYIGLANYRRALLDPIFWQAFGNVFLYAAVTVPVQMALGLAAALLLNRSLPGRTVFRALYFIPFISSWVVVSFIFSYLFSAPQGPVDYLLGDVVHIVPDTQSWFGDTTLALPALMVLGIWKGAGWHMMMFLAGLQSVPPELHEAAQVDGASAWTRLRFITLPLLRPVATFIAVVAVLSAFGTFIQVFLITQGGPLHSTETPLTYGYTNAFSTFDFGYGAAITYIFAVVVFVLSMIQLRLFRREAAS